MKQFIVLAVAAIIMCVTPAFAETAQNTNIQILIDKAKADKKLLIATNMDLTDQESKNFWPYYEGYQKKLEQINGHMGEIINEYADAYNKGSVPEDLAKKIINEALKAEGAEVIFGVKMFSLCLVMTFWTANSKLSPFKNDRHCLLLQAKKESLVL